MGVLPGDNSATLWHFPFWGAESLTMSPVILVVLPEGYKGRAFIAKNAPALTTSRVEKSIHKILEVNFPGILAKVVGAAERFGFSYRVLDAGPPLPLAAEDHFPA
jgi:hypothetical protein